MSDEKLYWVYPVYRNGRYQDQAGGYDDKNTAQHQAENAARYTWEDIQTPSFCRVEVVERPRDESGVHQVDKMNRRITNRNGRVIAVYYPGIIHRPKETIGEVR